MNSTCAVVSPESGSGRSRISRTRGDAVQYWMPANVHICHVCVPPQRSRKRTDTLSEPGTFALSGRATKRKSGWRTSAQKVGDVAVAPWRIRSDW